MALTAVIKAAPLATPDGATWSIRGILRLWRQETGTPTDLYLVVGDDIPTNGSWGQRIAAVDGTTLAAARDALLQRGGMTLAGYGRIMRRRFCGDLFVSGTMIDGYTG
jgi:hypothetical protein